MYCFYTPKPQKCKTKSKEFLEKCFKSLLFEFKLLYHTDIIKSEKIQNKANFETFRAILDMEWIYKIVLPF